MMGIFDDIKSIQLKQLHNDIIALHYYLLVSDMHKMEIFSDEAYKKAILTMYDTVTKQIMDLHEDISHSKQSG